MYGMECSAWLYTSTQSITTIQKLPGLSLMTKETLAAFGDLHLQPSLPLALHQLNAASLVSATIGILENASHHVPTIDDMTPAPLQAVTSLINRIFITRQRR